MKLFNLIASIALLATTALGQGVVIGSPADGSSVTAGSSIAVKINRPRTLSSSQDLSVVIGLQSCPTSACFAPTETMGIILYNGSYVPDPTGNPPSQTFTVTVPAGIAKGRAQLGVAHFALIGASEAPWLQTLNITLNVV